MSRFRTISWLQTSLCNAVIASSLFFLSPAAEAYPVTWEFTGTVSISAGNAYELSQKLTKGVAVRILVSFDTDETPTTRPSTGGRPGVRYDYFPADSVRFNIFGDACNPCTFNFVPGKGGMNVRDNFADPVLNPPPDVARDGFSFFMDPHPDNDNLGVLLLLRDLAAAFDPPIVDVGVDENPLPIEPDLRLAQMAESIFQVFDSTNGVVLVEVDLDSVKTPTLGTGYFLSARHCLYPDDPSYTGQFLGDDCVAGGNVPLGLATVEGGGAGHSSFNQTVSHNLPTPDPNDAEGAVDELGTVSGSIDFTGPLGMPILKGSSDPTDLGRTNTNLFGYQQYNFDGTETTPLELVVEVEYTIRSDAAPSTYPPENLVRGGQTLDTGVTPGGAELSLVMSIVDADVISPADIATQNFGTVFCGNESNLERANGDPWPAGSILGAAIYVSPNPQEGAQSTQLAIRACDGTDISDDPVMVSPGDSFHLTASMQTPARGKLKQDGSPGATDGGFVHAADTVRVIPDPEASPEVLEQLSSGIEPACENCGPPQIEIILRAGFE